MYLFDTVLVGPWRMFLLIFGVLLLHQLITRQALSNYNLDYIVQRGATYAAGVLILIFVLIQLNMYDIFSLLLVLLLLFILVYFESKNPLHIVRGINAKRKSFLLAFFKFIEKDVSFKGHYQNNKRHLFPKKIDFILLTGIGVAFTTFVSRYLFLKNDLYTLSELWIKNLEIIKGFNSGSWFQKGLGLKGELAFINFYAKITGISEEMAIHSFALVESFVLAILLCWLLQRILKSKFMAPIFAVLFFAVFYKYLPININLLLEHSPLYFAFCFALPAMVFTIKPKIGRGDKKSFFISLLFLYVAIGLSSMFVFFIVLPLFFIPAMALKTEKTSRYALHSLLAYLLSIFICMGVYYVATAHKDIHFREFLITNFIQINSYTHFPQLITGLDQLIHIYTIVGWVVTGFLVLLWFGNKKKWMPALVFQLFFNGFVLLKNINSVWFDVDLYHQTLVLLIVISVGIAAGLIVHYFQLSMPKKPLARAIGLTTFFIGVLAFSYVTNGFFKYDTRETEVLKEDILKVYNQLSSDYLPYSYAVVNQGYGQSLSTNTHHFISYEDFLETYTQRDSLYDAVKDNKPFLKRNPGYILPESIFVFVAQNSEEESNYDIETPITMLEGLEHQLGILRKRGRIVSVFFKDNYLTIYQIINQKRASKLDDLIFGKRPDREQKGVLSSL